MVPPSEKSAKFPVSAAKQRELERRMKEFGIREEDLEEKFVRSSGKGGQYVNRVATCVMLHHKPSGKRVKCQAARTQGLNRYYARKRLVEKIEEEIKGIESAKQQKIAKIKRQKRKRSKRAKEKMLEQKRKQAEKKELRRKVKLPSD
jgi:protein subunit release factor B